MGIRESFRRLVEELFAETKGFYGERLISFVVFGSYGRGTVTQESDLDVLIIAEPLPDGRMKRVKEFLEVEKRLGPILSELKRDGINTYISPVFKTPTEAEIGSPLFLDMTEDAIILYDRGDFFRSILERLKNRLSQLGAKRVWTGSSWHWILKGDYKPGEIFEI